jgi:hypothetical protein
MAGMRGGQNIAFSMAGIRGGQNFGSGMLSHHVSWSNLSGMFCVKKR